MKLIETGPLADDLERGLGEVHWLLKAYYPSLRLRAAVCGITSIALAEVLQKQDFDVELVESSPQLGVDPTMRHVMPIVHSDDGLFIIDATYSQFLEYAGLTPGYVMFGGKDLYPQEKIASFPYGQSDRVASTLSAASQYFLKYRQPVPEVDWKKEALVGLSEDAVEAVYGEIWSEAHFDTYEPSELNVEAGKKLAEFIVPEHVKLVA